MYKRFRFEVSKLFNTLYGHIFFPKDDLHGLFFRYGTTVILALLLIEFIYFSRLSLASFLLIATSFIGLNAFFCNLKTAVILIIFSYLVTNLFFIGETQGGNSLELIIFIITSIFLSLTIFFCKRTESGREWGRRERSYIREIKKLTEEKIKMHQEMKIHDEFISIASHELKTPLTSTLLKLQTALDNIRTVSLANFSIQNLMDMLESAEQQAQTLSKMINDLLNVSLIRNGQIHLELEEVDLSSMVQNIVDRFLEKANQEQIVIQTIISPGITGFYDRIKIEQVLSNLITNAIKYGEHKPILVKATKDSHNAHISVKDSGIGISKNIQDKIFNLFERGDNRQDHKGLGIGLFISYQIIMAHQGKLLVKSQPNKGSIFTIELPLKK